MNTNNNVYTIVYTTLIVVVVAAILAFVSQGLKDKQLANEKADTISQMMKADGLGSRADFEALGNENVLNKYAEEITEVLLVNTEGAQTGSLSVDRNALEVFSPSMLKAIWKNAKSAMREGKTPEIDNLPVFRFKNGYTVIPVYGDGLWGPVWGYISLDQDLRTIRGAYFDHESETAGLGAQIKDNAEFQKTFEGKIVNFEDEKAFAIVKGGVSTLPADKPVDNKIDAIAGATMTSNGLQDAINAWLGLYKAFLTGSACESVRNECHCGACPCGEACECDCHCPEKTEPGCNCPDCNCAACDGNHKDECQMHEGCENN